MATKKAEKTVNAPPATAGVQETALANVPLSTGLATTAMPAWLAQKMEGNAPRGLENMDRDDIIFPRLQLVQSTSPAFAEKRADLGDVLDSLSGDVIAKAGERLRFVPIVMTKMRMFMKPYNEGGDILCRADDSLTARAGGCGVDAGGNETRNCSDCVHKEWDDSKGNGKPACTLFYNVVGLLPDHGNRKIVWSAKSTDTKTAKRFLSVCKQTGADLFAHEFDLFAVETSNGNNTWQKWDFAAKGFVQEEAVYKEGERTFAGIQGKTWRADVSEQEASPEDTSFPPAEEEAPETVDAVPEKAPTPPPPPPKPAAKPAPAKGKSAF